MIRRAVKEAGCRKTFRRRHHPSTKPRPLGRTSRPVNRLSSGVSPPRVIEQKTAAWLVIRRKTGWLDPYFSGKIKWLFIKGAPRALRRACSADRQLAHLERAADGLTCRFDRASRTQFSISKPPVGSVAQALDIPSVLSAQSGAFSEKHSGHRGTQRGPDRPWGDQRAALLRQGCHHPGTMSHTGRDAFWCQTREKLIHSVRTDHGRPTGRKSVYAGRMIFIAGAVVQWLRDELKVLKDSAESEVMAKGVADTHGVYVVPAFTGLGAPYWDSSARGLITGLTRGANVQHLVRAALESIAYQTKDVFDLMQQEFDRTIPELNVDGGACRNDFLMQFQADMLQCRILRPKIIETTARGAALLAGVTVGLWDKNDLQSMRHPEKTFVPRMNPHDAKDLYSGWLKAVRKVRN